MLTSQSMLWDPTLKVEELKSLTISYGSMLFLQMVCLAVYPQPVEKVFSKLWNDTEFLVFTLTVTEVIKKTICNLTKFLMTSIQWEYIAPSVQSTYLILGMKSLTSLLKLNKIVFHQELSQILISADLPAVFKFVQSWMKWLWWLVTIAVWMEIGSLVTSLMHFEHLALLK